MYGTYDLGEFRQKGNIATKYGSRRDYLKAVNEETGRILAFKLVLKAERKTIAALSYGIGRGGVVSNAYLPVTATEIIILAFAVIVALFARMVYRTLPATAQKNGYFFSFILTTDALSHLNKLCMRRVQEAQRAARESGKVSFPAG